MRLLAFFAARARTAPSGTEGRPFPSHTLDQLGSAAGWPQSWRDRQWATEDEAREALGGDAGVLRSLVEEGRLPSYDIDGRRLIPSRDLAIVVARRSHPDGR